MKLTLVTAQLLQMFDKKLLSSTTRILMNAFLSIEYGDMRLKPNAAPNAVIKGSIGVPISIVIEHLQSITMRYLSKNLNLEVE